MFQILRYVCRGIARGLVVLGALTTCAIGTWVHAQSLPPVVQVEIAKNKKACEPDRIILKAGFLTTKDINGDGRPDYILDYEKAECGDSASYFCGSAGCLTQIFASLDDSTYIKVLGENVRAIRFANLQGRPAMILGLHGSACGRVGAAPCSETLYWNGSRFSPAN